MSKLITTKQIKIVKTILYNPGINLRGIIETTKLSPNIVTDHVNALVRRGVVKEQKLEKERVYLRQFQINLNSNSTKSLLFLIYEEEREDFFDKYPSIKKPLNAMAEIRNVKILIIYGSYARFSAEKDSDLDTLIIGKNINRDMIKENLVGLRMEPSIKIETPKQFENKMSDALHTQIIKEGIIIKGIEDFIEFLK